MLPGESKEPEVHDLRIQEQPDNQIIMIGMLILYRNYMNNLRKAKFISGDKEMFEAFNIGRVIGKGGNSFVYEVVDKEGSIQCIKEIRFEDKINEFIFRKEVELLMKLKTNPHPNIVEYSGNYILQETRSNYQTQRKGYIQMEKGLTNLKEFLQFKKEKQLKEYFSEDDVLCFITSMLDAFAHLQRLQLAHRDAKPSNILIFCQDPLYFKVCDVGAGTAVGLCDQTKQGTVIGTYNYLSPELLIAHMKHHHLTNYNPFKSDVYSLGLVILEFCCLKRPTREPERQEEEIASMIRQIKGRYSNIVGLGKVLRKMLQGNVKNRFDFLELDLFIHENDLLRNKINSNITLDPQLMDKLSSSKEIFIQSFEELPNISKIISTGNNAEAIKIELSSSNGTLQNGQKQMFQEIKNIKHMNSEEFSLKMECCDLTEKQAQIIAQSIHKNSKLKIVTLNIWNNKIKNEGIMKILMAIQTIIHSLEQLSLIIPSNQIRFNQEIGECLCFEKAEKLKKLFINFSFNDINPEHVQNIFYNISLAPSISELSLYLQSMKLSHVHFNRGIKEFQRCTGLQKLIINASNNSIRDQGIFGLSDFLLACKNLSELELHLRHSQITDKGLGQLLKSIGGVKVLKLNFIGNEITEKGMEKGFPHFQGCTNISSLNINLSNNKIGDAGIKQLSKSLTKLTDLQMLRLILDGCGLGYVGCLHIGRLISQQVQLPELQLSLRYNLIEFKGIQCLSSGLIEMKKIRRLKLVLEGTLVGDIAANLLGKCLLKIRTLSNVELNMQNCNLSGQTMQNILNLVKLCSRTAEEITVSMRKNTIIRKQLYEKIKKQLNCKRIAIKVDQPQNHIQSP